MLFGGRGALAVDRLRLADVIAEARARNPELAAFRNRVEGASRVRAQVVAWDDPAVSYEAWNAPDSARLDRSDNSIFRLAQPVPFPGKRRIAGEAADARASMMRAELAAKELDVVAAVEHAYYALWQAEETLAVYERDRALVDRLAHSTLERYRLGLGSQPDVLRAQVELTHRMNEVQTQKLEIERARVDLLALLSREPDTPLGPANPPSQRPMDLDGRVLRERALRDRPEIEIRRATIRAAEARLRGSELDRLPDFEIAFSRFVNPGSRDGLGAMASMTLPFANPAKYSAAIGAARSELAAARSDLRLTEDTIRREVADAEIRARAAHLRHELLAGTHQPQAEQSLAASEIAYESGHGDFSSLVEAVRAVESLHLDHVSAAADLARALADLERAVGGELPVTGDDADAS